MTEVPPASVEEFNERGYLLLRSFYDIESEIAPLLRDVHRLIGLLAGATGYGFEQPDFCVEHFDAGLGTMLAARRSLVSSVYDAVKKLPSAIDLACAPKNRALAATLLDSDFIGFANRGYGMRMDHPGEDEYLTQWHQDYPSQLCSPRGIVLWTPLRRVTAALGPVEVCPGSQADGILPIVRDGGGSKGLQLRDEAAVTVRFPSTAPEMEVGDVLVADFLLVHRSSPNRSEHTRWAMLSRYFDLTDPVGARRGWIGGLQEGHLFDDVHPELMEIAT